MAQESVKNRVFYFTAPKKLEIRTEDCPPPGPGEVRCKTICSLVSIGTEMICFARQVEKGSGWDQWIQYPFETGYLSVGEIMNLGEGVEGYNVGDRVCSNAPHRAWFIDKAFKLIPVPNAVSSEDASWFHINIIVQNGIREVRPVFGESAVVIGLGPLGQIAVRLLGVAGLKHLIAIDPFPLRCRLAEGQGPTEVWQERADQMVDRVLERTKGFGAEMVFDITGNPVVFHASHKMLCKRGRMGLIGDVPHPSQQTMSSDVIGKGVAIISAHGAIPPFEGNPYYRWGRKEMNDFFFHAIASGRFRVDNLVTHRITPDEAPKAYLEILEHRNDYLGVIIDWRK